MANKNAGQHFRDWKAYNVKNSTNLTFKEWKEATDYQPKPKYVAKNPRGPRKKKEEVQPVVNHATATGESVSDLDSEGGAV